MTVPALVPMLAVAAVPRPRFVLAVVVLVRSLRLLLAVSLLLKSVVRFVISLSAKVTAPVLPATLVTRAVWLTHLLELVL
jgi:hypothetical protein